MQHDEEDAANGARGAIHPAPTPLATYRDRQETPPESCSSLHPPLTGEEFLRGIKRRVQLKQCSMECPHTLESCPGILYCLLAPAFQCFGVRDVDMTRIVIRTVKALVAYHKKKLDCFGDYVNDGFMNFREQVLLRHAQAVKELSRKRRPRLGHWRHVKMDVFALIVMGAIVAMAFGALAAAIIRRKA